MASFVRQWRTEKPAMLQSMGSQRVGHNWLIEWEEEGKWLIESKKGQWTGGLDGVKELVKYGCKRVKWIEISSQRVFQVALMVKNPPANVEDAWVPGLIPGLGRCPGEGNGNPLQYSCLENLMDRGTWWATVHGLQRFRYDWSNWTTGRGGLSPTFRGLTYQLP